MSLIAVVAWALPHEARACVCMPLPAPALARDKADAVFEARIDGFEGEGEGMVRYGLTVQRVFKGEVPAATSLVTSSSSAACGRRFVVGRRYLVYAYRRDEGDLGDTMCSRTRLIATADEDLAVLGAGAPPRAPPAPEAQSREPPRIEPAAAPPALAGLAPGARRGCDVGGPSGPVGLVLIASLRRRRRTDVREPAPAGPTFGRQPC